MTIALTIPTWVLSGLLYLVHIFGIPLALFGACWLFKLTRHNPW